MKKALMPTWCSRADLDGGPGFDAKDLVLNVNGRVDHFGDVLVVHGCEHGNEVDVANVTKYNVEGHVDLSILVIELHRCDISVATGCDNIAHNLDEFKDVDNVVLQKVD